MVWIGSVKAEAGMRDSDLQGTLNRNCPQSTVCCALTALIRHTYAMVEVVWLSGAGLRAELLGRMLHMLSQLSRPCSWTFDHAPARADAPSFDALALATSVEVKAINNTTFDLS